MDGVPHQEIFVYIHIYVQYVYAISFFFIYNRSRLMTDPVEFFIVCVCVYSFLTPLISFSMGLRQDLGMLAPSLAQLYAWEAANGPLAFRLKARADLILWGNNK